MSYFFMEKRAPSSSFECESGRHSKILSKNDTKNIFPRFFIGNFSQEVSLGFFLDKYFSRYFPGTPSWICSRICPWTFPELCLCTQCIKNNLCSCLQCTRHKLELTVDVSQWMLVLNGPHALLVAPNYWVRMVRYRQHFSFCRAGSLPLLVFSRLFHCRFSCFLLVLCRLHRLLHFPIPEGPRWYCPTGAPGGVLTAFVFCQIRVTYKRRGAPVGARETTGGFGTISVK